MRFRLGMLTGFAGGYYLGAKAGRERYEQLNNAIRRARGHDAVVAATEKIRPVVEDKVTAAKDKAQDLVDNRLGNGQSGQSDPITPLP